MSCARLAALAAGVLVPASLGGQIRVDGRTAVFYESYSFGSGLVFNQLSELTVPLGVNLRFGATGTLALSGGYARVDLRSSGLDPTLGNQQISGPLDTEARVSVNVVPGKLVALVTGVIPTGIKSVRQQELSVLGAISSDVVGFTATSLGSGGNVGGGFAGAVPVGRFALGFGATYRQPMGYVPVLGETRELRPGAELKFRTGVEGAVARRTYVRLAGILARTQKDRIAVAGVGDSTKNGLGNRVIGYLSVNQGLGRGSVTVYGFDVFRGDPQIEQTAVGAARLPRGNLVAGGARIDWPLGERVVVSPQAEFRMSSAAPSDTVTALEKLGQSVRAGADVRIQATSRATLVFQGSGVSGHVIQSGARVSVSGYRASLFVELNP
ncbi:MAG TPA: hypothetical protein VNL18_06205 [Gemmatimonadales bacterium]|nr:hypothetical protein [Gemmatimonadales bacterium]